LLAHVGRLSVDWLPRASWRRGSSSIVSAIAAGGRTIAVLGTPLADAYPAKNRALQQRIMREHLAVSQFAPGVPTRPANFPIRNRTMALLSDATIIVEASEKSGSLHQGWEALRLGRPLFVLRSQFDDPELLWPRELERYGAQPLDLNDLEALVEALPERAGGISSALTL
jgi:DNA processing protein